MIKMEEIAILFHRNQFELKKIVLLDVIPLILKGTVLGDNCVVGAGAVVSGRFEDSCIIVGNSGKILRKGDYNE